MELIDCKVIFRDEVNSLKPVDLDKIDWKTEQESFTFPVSLFASIRRIKKTDFCILKLLDKSRYLITNRQRLKIKKDLRNIK